MLYVIYKRNHRELTYRGGQDSIVHLEANLRTTVKLADQRGRRWAFTLTNAGSNYFEDHCDLNELDRIDWMAVQARAWRSCKEAKQAEFLIERSFPWWLVTRVGVPSQALLKRVREIVQDADRELTVRIMKGWYS